MSESTEAGRSRATGGRRRRLRLERWLLRAVFESALIVFSVFLALALSDWNADRRMDRRVQEVRGFFAQEVRANRDRLVSDRVLPHHRRLQAALAELREGPPTQAAAGRATAAFSTGVHPAFLRDAVWQSASRGEVFENMEPREVFMLADIYRLQEELTQLNRSMYAVIVTTPADYGDLDAMRAGTDPMRLYLGDVVALEQELAAMYDAALRRLETEG